MTIFALRPRLAHVVEQYLRPALSGLKTVLQWPHITSLCLYDMRSRLLYRSWNIATSQALPCVGAVVLPTAQSADNSPLAVGFSWASASHPVKFRCPYAHCVLSMRIVVYTVNHCTCSPLDVCSTSIRCGSSATAGYPVASDHIAKALRRASPCVQPRPITVRPAPRIIA